MSTNAKIKELRKHLEDEKKRLMTELDQIKSDARSTDARREGSPFGKREEEATEALELEKRLVMEQKLNEQLTATEHALEKFEKGTYGQCDICGQSIEWGRMEALPQASVCMKCKTEQAKNGNK